MIVFYLLGSLIFYACGYFAGAKSVHDWNDRNREDRRERAHRFAKSLRMIADDIEGPYVEEKR